jgi:hypothetical protein
MLPSSLPILGLWAVVLPSTIAWRFSGFSGENCNENLEFSEASLEPQRCKQLEPGDTRSFGMWEFKYHEQLFLYESLEECETGYAPLDIFNSDNNAVNCYEWDDAWAAYQVF